MFAPPSPPRRIEQLTPLRFMAALAVLSSHMWPLAEEPNPVQPLAKSLFHEGFAGVSFFFMLSGFILSHTYQSKLATGLISRGKYLALRLARIAPLHWLVALAFVGLAGRGAAEGGKVALNLALLHSWVPDSGWYFSVVGPSWSLSDEVFFYTCFAFLAFLTPRVLVQFAAVLLLADAAMVSTLVASGHGAVWVAGVPTLTHWLTYVFPVTRLADFVVGMVIYHLPVRMVTPARATVDEALSLALMLAAVVLFPALGVADAWRMQLAYLPMMALVIRTFARGGGALSRMLAGNRTLVLLGDASFALYLIHLPIIGRLFALWEVMETPWPLLPTALAVTALCVALSVVIYLYVETPLLRLSRRAIDRVFAR